MAFANLLLDTLDKVEECQRNFAEISASEKKPTHNDMYSSLLSFLTRMQISTQTLTSDVTYVARIQTITDSIANYQISSDAQSEGGSSRSNSNDKSAQSNCKKHDSSDCNDNSNKQKYNCTKASSGSIIINNNSTHRHYTRSGDLTSTSPKPFKLNCASFSDIPPEIVTKILGYAVTNDGGKSIDHTMCNYFSLVCAKWHLCVQDIRQLQKSIAISGNKEKQWRH